MRGTKKKYIKSNSNNSRNAKLRRMNAAKVNRRGESPDYH